MILLKISDSVADGVKIWLFEFAGIFYVIGIVAHVYLSTMVDTTFQSASFCSLKTVSNG